MTTRPSAAQIPSRATSASSARVREIAFAGLIAVYALLTVGVLIYPSPVLAVDQWWLDQHLWGNHPQYHWFVNHYVMLGQRGPVAAVWVPLFAWLSWRRRSTQPLVMLGTSLLLLNLSVAVVKYAVGRVGPRHSDDVHQVFAGGTLFPSGHVSNTVVMYGVLAMVIPRFRKSIVAAVVFLCLTVGIGTIYLRTHWFSDVVGGWIAGGLVLLVLPEVMPTAQRWSDRALAWYLERRRRRSAGRDAKETVIRPPDAGAEPVPARTRVSAGSPTRFQGGGFEHRYGRPYDGPATPVS